MPLRSGIVDLQCVFTLNETGGFVWDELAEPRTVEQIAKALVATYDVELRQAAQDVQDVVEQLVAEGCAVELPEKQAP